MGATSTVGSSSATPAAAALSFLDMASIKSTTVVKAFDLPVVSDTYNTLAKLASPMSPLVVKIGSLTSPAMDQVLGLKAGIEAKVPDVVSTGINSALAQVVRPKRFFLVHIYLVQVTSAAVSVDAKLSSGIDNLVEKMPALKEATPVFYDSTR